MVYAQKVNKWILTLVGYHKILYTLRKKGSFGYRGLNSKEPFMLKSFWQRFLIGYYSFIYYIILQYFVV